MNAEQLVELVMALHLEERLCLVHVADSSHEPQIICSMGLFEEKVLGQGDNQPHDLS